MEKEKISDREEIRKIVKSFNYNQYENISAEVSEEMDFIDLAIKHYNYDAFAWFLEKTGSSPRLTYFNMNDLLIVIDLCCKGGNLTGFSQTYHMLKKAVSSGYFMDKFQMNYFTEICDKLGRPDLLTEVCSDTGKKNSFSFGEANSFSFGEANSFSFGEANSLSDCKVEKKGKTGKPFFPELGKYDSANDARKITFGDRTYTHSEYQSLLEKEGVDPVLLAEIKNKDRLLTSLGISSEEKVKEEQGEQIIHQVAKEESSEKKDNIFERLAPLYGFCPSDSENMGQAHFQAISEQYSEKPPCFLQLKRDHADKTFRLFFSTIIKSLN